MKFDFYTYHLHWLNCKYLIAENGTHSFPGVINICQFQDKENLMWIDTRTSSIKCMQPEIYRTRCTYTMNYIVFVCVTCVSSLLSSVWYCIHLYIWIIKCVVSLSCSYSAMSTRPIYTIIAQGKQSSSTMSCNIVSHGLIHTLQLSTQLSFF